MRVTHFYREPRKTGLSIEGIFQTVKADLKGEVDIVDFYCDGTQSRYKNVKRAKKAATDVNHITGDVNFLAMGLKGKNTILTVHDLGFYENPVHSRLVKTVYELFWFRLPLRSVDLVTVVSDFTRQKLMHYFRFPADRVRIVPDPVKPVFRWTEQRQPNERPVVLMLGTGKHKNLDNLIAASQGLDVHLDIVGWPAADELQRLKEYNISHTVYNGLTDEQVYERYVACDILYIASHYEGFGMPIVEAQAVGRPVITGNTGAMLEVGRESALLVDPTKPEETREAIQALAEPELRAEMIAVGKANAAKYDHRIVAQQYKVIYEELAQKKHR